MQSWTKLRRLLTARRVRESAALLHVRLFWRRWSDAMREKVAVAALVMRFKALTDQSRGHRSDPLLAARIFVLAILSNSRNARYAATLFQNSAVTVSAFLVSSQTIRRKRDACNR